MQYILDNFLKNNKKIEEGEEERVTE